MPSEPITSVNAPDGDPWHIPDPAMLRARPAFYTVFWATPGASFSMGIATRQRAEEAFANLCLSASVRHASLHHGEELLRQHDYDPYAWHDTRQMVGR